MNRQIWQRAAYLFLGLVSLVSLITVGHYGLTWDEAFIVQHGDAVYDWYASGFQDPKLMEHDNRLYGALFSLAVKLLDHVSPLRFYDTQHILCVLLGLLTLLGAFRLGALLWDPRAGFFGLVVLASFPRFYGHMFANPKDIPFAAFYLWSVYFILRTVDRRFEFDTKKIFCCTLLMSLTLGIRMAGLILLFYLAVFWLMILVKKAMLHEFRLATLLRFAAMLAVVTLGSMILTLPWWPYLQLAPLPHLLEVVVDNMGHEFPLPVLFRGEYIMAAALPRTYLPVWTFIALPEFFLLLLALGVVLALLRIRSMGSFAHFSIQQLRQLGFIFAGTFGYLLIIVLKPTIFDGLRHNLYLFPLFAVMAGAALSAFLDRHLPRPIRWGVCGLVAISFLVTASDMLNLHPYQTVYFNRLFGGGLSQASSSYPTDYYGSSHKAGFEWLAANATTTPGRPIRVAGCMHAFLFDYYIQEDPALKAKFVAVELDKSPDIALLTTRWKCHESASAPVSVYHVIQRDLTPLLNVVPLTEQGRRALSKLERP